MISKRVMQVACVLGLSSLALGCGSSPTGSGESAPDGENIGQAQFDLMNVPSGIGCVRIVVTGSSTVSKDFTLAANASTASLNMDRLPLGAIAIDGSAYAATCGTGSALYVANTATTTLSAGVVSSVALTFRKNNQVTASVNFVGNIQAISAGNAMTSLLIDGQVYNWGAPSSFIVPTAISGFTGMVDLAQGFSANDVCALKADGTVWCWGGNFSGQVGVATPTTLTTPTQFGTLNGYGAVAVGVTATYGVRSAVKEIRDAGFNGQAELGNGNANPISGLQALSFTTNSVTDVTAGMFHACALSGNLSVYCWGENGRGQVGIGTTTGPVLGPTKTSASPAKDVCAGTWFSCAAMADGTAKCWGDNANNQLGDGTNVQRLVPTAVSGLSGVSKIACQSLGACALLDSGIVKCWGYNADGELGDASLLNRATPVTVTLPDTAVSLTAGESHACAVTAHQDIYCWGDNTWGELGDGTFSNAVKPVRVLLP